VADATKAVVVALTDIQYIFGSHPPLKRHKKIAYSIGGGDTATTFLVSPL
jgi:hypothetical protein